MAIGKWGKYQCNVKTTERICGTCGGTGAEMFWCTKNSDRGSNPYCTITESRCQDNGTTITSRYGRTCGKGYDGVFTVPFISDLYKCDYCRGTGKLAPIITYSKGSFISNVTATTGTYPQNGRHTDGLWYVYIGLVPPNEPPTLTVPDTITGGKISTISWSQATSEGAAISGYELHRSLNNGTFTRVYRGSALTYADTVPYGTNTVQYSVRSYDVDNQLSPFKVGEVKTVVNNNPPVITCTDTDKGELEEGFTVHYSVTDEDAADTIMVTEAIDGVTLRSFAATRATDYTVDVTALTWLKLLNGLHTLTITAVDNRGGTAVKSINFTKAVHEIEFELTTPLTCDAAVTKAMMQMLAVVPAGALVQIFACNNGYDVEPTWIDVTLKVLNNEKIFFANTEKTADKWGHNVRVIIDRNGAQGDCFITSIGGNFE